MTAVNIRSKKIFIQARLSIRDGCWCLCSCQVASQEFTHVGDKKVGARILGLTYLEAIECGLEKTNLRGSSWGKLVLIPSSRSS